MTLAYYKQDDLRKMLDLNSDMIEFQGLKANPNASDSSVPTVYGYQRVVGPRVFFSSGKSSETLVVAYALSQDEIAGVTQLLIDDQYVTLGQGLEDGDEVSVTTGPYANVLSVELRTTQSGSSNIIRQETGIIFKPLNLSYIVIRAGFTQGGPFRGVPKVSCDILGKKIWNGTEIAYNNNPAWVMRDLLGKSVGNQIYIDQTAISTLASYFDEVVAYNSEATGPRYTCNTIVDTDTPIIRTVRQMQEAFNVYNTWTNGKYVLISEEQEQASPPSITEANIIGDITVNAPDLGSAYTKVEFDYRIPDSGFATYSESLNINQCLLYPSTQGFAGGVTNTSSSKRISLPMVFNPEMASRIARAKLLKQTYQSSYTFTIDSSLWNTYFVGKQIVIDLEEPNITKTVIITSLKYNRDHTVDVTAVDWDDSYYLSGLNPTGSVKGVFYYNYYNNSGQKVVAKSSGKLDPTVAFAYNEPTVVDEYQTIVYDTPIDLPVYTPPEQVVNPGITYAYDFATADTFSDNAGWYRGHMDNGVHDYYNASNTNSVYDRTGVVTTFDVIDNFSFYIKSTEIAPVLYQEFSIIDRQARTDLNLFFVYELDDGQFGYHTSRNEFIVHFDPERGDDLMQITNKYNRTALEEYGFYPTHYVENTNQKQAWPTWFNANNRLLADQNQKGLYKVGGPQWYNGPQGIRYNNTDWGFYANDGNMVGEEGNKVVKIYRAYQEKGAYDYVGQFTLNVDYSQIITPNLGPAKDVWSNTFAKAGIERPF